MLLDEWMDKKIKIGYQDGKNVFFLIGYIEKQDEDSIIFHDEKKDRNILIAKSVIQKIEEVENG